MPKGLRLIEALAPQVSRYQVAISQHPLATRPQREREKIMRDALSEWTVYDDKYWRNIQIFLNGQVLGQRGR